MLPSRRFDDRTEADLVSLANWIGARADPETAREYVMRIRGRDIDVVVRRPR